MGKLKWTKEKVQEKSNNIHNNKFIIHDVVMKEYGKQGRKQSYMDLECTICGHQDFVVVDSHINRKSGCAQCAGKNPWTLEKIRKLSKIIHNNNFTIHNIKIQKFNKTNIDLECKICNHRKWIQANDHINGRYGCGGKCKITLNKNQLIDFLKINPEKANELHNYYFLKFTNKTNLQEIFYKIGKTKKSIKQRFTGKMYSDYNIETICIMESTHLLIAMEENEFINKYHGTYGYVPNKKFDGYTECFKPEIIKEF
jgi:hypothetical protein